MSFAMGRTAINRRFAATLAITLIVAALSVRAASNAVLQGVSSVNVSVSVVESTLGRLNCGLDEERVKTAAKFVFASSRLRASDSASDYFSVIISVFPIKREGATRAEACLVTMVASFRPFGELYMRSTQKRLPAAHYNSWSRMNTGQVVEPEKLQKSAEESVESVIKAFIVDWTENN